MLWTQSPCFAIVQVHVQYTEQRAQLECALAEGRQLRKHAAGLTEQLVESRFQSQMAEQRAVETQHEALAARARATAITQTLSENAQAFRECDAIKAESELEHARREAASAARKRFRAELAASDRRVRCARARPALLRSWVVLQEPSQTRMRHSAC